MVLKSLNNKISHSLRSGVEKFIKYRLIVRTIAKNFPSIVVQNKSSKTIGGNPGIVGPPRANGGGVHETCISNLIISLIIVLEVVGLDPDKF